MNDTTAQRMSRDTTDTKPNAEGQRMSDQNDEMRATESERIDLGQDHSAVLRYMDGELWGLAYDHLKPDGTPCIRASWIPLRGEDDGWTLKALDPLHIEPSLLCRACGDHGFIRDGRWAST